MTDNFFKIAPFKIYSSSVDTGYAAEISASFKPGLDIVNMHTDRYSDLNDAPVQSPFTYRYVGGSQHRHAPLNDGTDEPLTRPELFHISMSAGTLKIVGPDEIDVNRPRAYFFRDTFAKRPINIANIKTVTGSGIGNYTNDYEIIQTVGRTSNNKAFIEATGSGFAQYLTTQYVTGAKDPNRALPDFTGSLSSGRFIFVNRFNAPGGTEVSSRGVLDTYAEEYAPNNAMPWRNRSARSLLRSDLARHTPSATEISSPGGDLFPPTEYHSDNRNKKVGTVFDQVKLLHSGSGVGNPESVAVDEEGGMIYWFDEAADEIKRAPINPTANTSIETIVSGYSNIYNIAIDKKERKLYWCYPAGIGVGISIVRSNLDGTSIDLPFSATSGFTGTDATSILIDNLNRNIYIVESDQHLARVSLDDATTAHQHPAGLVVTSFARNLALDAKRGFLYWVDPSTYFTGLIGRIRRISVNPIGGGTFTSAADEETVIRLDEGVSNTSVIRAIAIDENFESLFYGTTPDSSFEPCPADIRRVNLNKLNDLPVSTMNITKIGHDYTIGDVITTFENHPDRFAIHADGILVTNSDVHPFDDCDDAKTIVLIAMKKDLYDNGFVNHEIPQSDIRYRWISDSAITAEYELPGHQNSSSVPFGAFDDITFFSASWDNRGDYIGISGSAIDKAAISIQTTTGSDAINMLSKSDGTSFSVYNGPYQHSSWKQVRNHQNPVVRQLARESILSLANTPETIKNSLDRQVSSKRSDGITNFREPVISEDSRPAEHTLLVRPSLDSQIQLTSSVKYTLSNDITTFTNQKIRDRLGIKRNLDSTLYAELKDMYLDPEVAGTTANPVDAFSQMDYSRVLYPSPINTFLNTTRERTEYAEAVGTGSNGYDRIFGTQRTFYREDLIRTDGAKNSQGARNNPTGIPVDKTYDPSDSIDIDFSLDASSQVAQDTNSGSEVFIFGTKAGSLTGERSLLWKDSYQTASAISAISMSFEITKGEYQINSQINLEEPQWTQYAVYLQYKSVLTGTSWQNVTVSYYDSGSLQEWDRIYPTQLTASFYTTVSASFDPGESVYLRLNQPDFSSRGTSAGYQFDNYAIRNLSLTGTLVDAGKPALNFNSMATDGIRSFPESSSYRDYNGELMQDSDDTAFTANPLPSLSYLELYNTKVNNTSSGYVERLTEQVAGKNSWYDTYEDYAVDVRPHSKNKSVVPEFRMSEHIPYYIIEKGDLSFRSENKKFLSLDGASITSSANDEDDCTFNPTFINRYARTTDSGHLVEIAKEHSDGQSGEISKVEFSCKALKKLLPYNGFYPKDRAVQLGNLLSESLGGHVEGSYDGNTTSYPKQGWMGILKPLMSPGILFNSIKSGIAVDYPIYTGSVPGLVEGSANTPSDFQLSSGSNYRLPFETLIDLKGNLPEGSNNPIRLVSSFITDESGFDTSTLFNYKSVWTGQKTSLFELGMHNFLAESVNFFLEGEEKNTGGKLTNFRSKQQPADGWQFDSNKTYYMDVVLRDTVEMNKFIEYSGSGEVVVNLKFGASDGELSDRFGYSVDAVVGAPGEGIYAVVGNSFESSPTLPTAYLFQNKLDSAGWQQKLELTASDGAAYDFFANSVSIASGSDGIYILCGAYGDDDQGSTSGAAYIYHSTSAGIITEQKLTASDGHLRARFGYSVSIASGTDGIYALCGAYGDDDKGSSAGAAYIYHSTSAGILTEQKLTASDGQASDWFGESVSIASGTDGIYAICGASLEDATATTAGAAYIYHSTSAGILTEQKLTASDGQMSDLFGNSVSIASGSDATLYTVIGAPGGNFAVSGSGAGYMFAGEFGSLSGTIGIQNIQQDYKQHGKLFGLPLEDVYDPAYAAYTPPMFYGEAIARIKFSPPTDTTYKLDEILAMAEVEEIINVDTNRVATVNGFKKSLTTVQEQNRMPISSSVNLFGKYFEPEVAFDPETGQPTSISQTSNLNPSWVISTRYECPVLDVSSSKYNELYTSHASDAGMATNYNFYPGQMERFNPRTMWTSYGQPPKGTKRVTLELANSFADYKENPDHASLIDACGFTAGDKDIGKVRGTKQIHESVVMIPYLDEPVDGVTTEIEGKNFIAIDSSDTSRYADQRSNFERFGYAVQADQNNGEKINHTSITRMLKGMQMFNIPPNMNFYKHGDITPFAMYFFPFSKDLSRTELADIWQGVMPQSAIRTEDDRIDVSHDVNKFEFFGNLKDRTLISKMRFMVFKVKQIAKQNYYEITEDSTDDSRYQFKFSSDGQTAAVPHPSYNWPYDYFSLVEDATIEAKYTIKKDSEE